MTTRVVVLGAGYAGCAAVTELESAASDDLEIVWISEDDYHLLLHEVHRTIRDPTVESSVTIPVAEIKDETTEFREGRVVGVDTDARAVELEDGERVGYDYLIVAIGSATADFGIEGVDEHAHYVESLEATLRIHEEIRAAAEGASWEEPARVVVGGGGMSGVQVAGEVAELRDRHEDPIDVTIVEGLDDVLPKGDPGARESVRRHLTDRGVTIRTGSFVTRVDDEHVYVDEGATPLAYDVLIWTGGIAGHEEAANVDVAREGRSGRIHAGTDLRTDDERVFAVGDAALVEQGDDRYAPPTSQAAWGAAEVAARNVLHELRGEPLESYHHVDKGTAISVGDDTVVYDVVGLPFETIEGIAGRTLKRAIAARWIVSVSSVRTAVRAWGDM